MESTALRRVAWTLWIFLLIPLSVDNLLQFPVGPYDVRMPYLVTAITLIGAGVSAVLGARSSVFGREMRTFFAAYLREPFVLAFLFFGAVGIAGWLGVSEFRSRSFMFLLWTGGTLLGAPLLARVFQYSLGPWMWRSLALYVSAQTLVLAHDFVRCEVAHGRGALGLIYFGWYGEQCRPHAFYQEPQFYAGFAILVLVWMRQILQLGLDRNWHRFYVACLAVSGLGVILSTSRFGWVAVASLAAIEGLYQAWRHRGRLNLKVWAGALAGAVAIVGAVGLIAPNGPIGRTMASFKKIVEGRDPSGNMRLRNLQFAWDVMERHPWTGVGPGGGGAYVAAHWIDHPYVRKYSVTKEPDPEYLRNNPATTSGFGEVLMEWGVPGFIAWCLGLLFLLRGLRGVSLYWAVAAVPMVFATSQTMPRFDLWFTLGLLWAASVAVANRTSTVGGTRLEPTS